MKDELSTIVDKIARRHQRMIQAQGAGTSVSLCRGCKSPNGVYNILWPCDVITLWEITTGRSASEFDTYEKDDTIVFVN